MARALRALAISEREKTRSVTYGTDRENEVFIVIIIIVAIFIVRYQSYRRRRRRHHHHHHLHST